MSDMRWTAIRGEGYVVDFNQSESVRGVKRTRLDWLEIGSHLFLAVACLAVVALGIVALVGS